MKGYSELFNKLEKLISLKDNFTPSVKDVLKAKIFKKYGGDTLEELVPLLTKDLKEAINKKAKY